MITASQKATILQKNGISVPAFPERRLPIQEPMVNTGAPASQENPDADADRREAVAAWNRTIDALYAAYAAARAAKSLREAEEASSLARLRQENSRREGATK